MIQQHMFHQLGQLKYIVVANSATDNVSHYISTTDDALHQISTTNLTNFNIWI